MAHVNTDKSKIDVEKVIRFLLDESYWAKNRTVDQIKRSLDHSLCFAVYEDDEMIAFARVITDYAIFAYLADVFVDKEFRGKGHAKLLMNAIMKHPDLQTIHRWMLGTMDAHELYRPYGFQEVTNPKRWMEYMPKGSEIAPR